MPDFKIDIHSLNDHNTMAERGLPTFDEYPVRLKAEGGAMASRNVRIVFEPSAVKALFESISWGSRYKRGDVEQAGILIGNYYRDSASDGSVVWADVVMVIPADPQLVHASFETIDITAEAWRKMYESADGYRAENLQILGWYHTHLSHIHTRFSGLDRATQRKAFTFPYSFGVVFNPNQEKWSAFYGPESKECVGVLLLDEELAARNQKPQITIRQVNGDSELQEDGSVVHLDEEGRPIRPQAPRQAPEDTGGDEEDEDLSFRQLVGQFVTGMGKLIAGPKKRPARGNPARSDQRRPASRSASEPRPAERVRPVEPRPAERVRPVEPRPVERVRPAEPRPAERPASTPKIEIKATRGAPPEIRCAFYSFATDDDCTLQKNFRCRISPEDVEAILRDLARTEEERALWGKLAQSDAGGEELELTLSSEQEANAKIISARDILRQDRLKLVAQAQQRNCPESIRFIVLVDGSGDRTVDINIVHFSRGNVI